jgi:Eukaryotic aspartyl protease
MLNVPSCPIVLTPLSLNSTFGVGYGIGGVSGTAFRDTVVIGEASGRAQIIGAANMTNGFNLVRPIDGIRTFVASV